jgi:hypothetical protein
MILTFRRSDAMAERGDANATDDVTIAIDGNVQLTYTVLREINTSNPIATCIDGDWYIDSRFDDVDDRGPYSDIIIDS